MQLIFWGIGIGILAIIGFVVHFNENYEDEDDKDDRRYKLREY